MRTWQGRAATSKYQNSDQLICYIYVYDHGTITLRVYYCTNNEQLMMIITIECMLIGIAHSEYNNVTIVSLYFVFNCY